MHFIKYLLLLLILAGCTAKVKKEKQARTEFPESYLIAQDSAPVFDSLAVDRFLNAEKKFRAKSHQSRPYLHQSVLPAVSS